MYHTVGGDTTFPFAGALWRAADGVPILASPLFIQHVPSSRLIARLRFVKKTAQISTTRTRTDGVFRTGDIFAICRRTGL